MNVLFCDDDIRVGDIAKQMFLHSNADFVYAKSISQAKAALDIGKFDIVIIDLIWNDSHLNGFEIVEYIAKMKDVKPLVYVTSGNLERFAAELKEYGSRINGAFKKPEELLAFFESFVNCHALCSK